MNGGSRYVCKKRGRTNVGNTGRGPGGSRQVHLVGEPELAVEERIISVLTAWRLWDVVALRAGGRADPGGLEYEAADRSWPSVGRQRRCRHCKETAIVTSSREPVERLALMADVL